MSSNRSIPWIASLTIAASAGAAVPQDCRTTMVSVGTSGALISLMDASGGSISDDGSVAVFHVLAFNHPSSPQHAWAHDSAGGQTQLLDVTLSGGQGVGRAYSCDVSGDGRYALFNSQASDLVPGDTNGWRDMFVRDLLLGVTTRVSVDASGVQANGQSAPWGALNVDGRFAVFSSSASNLVAGDANGFQDIFVRDRQSGVVTLASLTSAGAQSNHDSWFVDVSADGRYVVFDSFASNLVPGDTNAAWDVFVRDLAAGTTTLVSRSLTGGPGGGLSEAPRISRDGRFVAFSSNAPDLVAGDTNGEFDAFVAELASGAVERASLSQAGLQLAGSSAAAGLSGDGRLVLFSCSSDDVLAGDANQAYDVFLRDRATGGVKLLSVSTEGSQGFSGHHSFGSDLTPGGQFASFRGPEELAPMGTLLGGILVRGCPQAVTRYGRGQLHSAGCEPFVTWTGRPSRSTAQGFTIRAEQERNQVPGLFFYGFERQLYPLNQAHVQVMGRIKRLAIQGSGGSPSGLDCTGAFQVDFNAHIASGVDPVLAVGIRVFGQFWSRDPGQPPGSDYSLTDAVDFTIGP